MFGRSAGSGLKDISYGCAFGLEGRYSSDCASNLDAGRMYPLVERAGVQIEVKPLQMEL
jgi:hypothetical protein